MGGVVDDVVDITKDVTGVSAVEATIQEGKNITSDVKDIYSDRGDIADIAGATITQDPGTVVGGILGGSTDTSTPSLNIDTILGTGPGTATSTFKEDEEQRKSISKKRLGTRGLQIPLTANVSTTAGEAGGIQI